MPRSGIVCRAGLASRGLSVCNRGTFSYYSLDIVNELVLCYIYIVGFRIGGSR